MKKTSVLLALLITASSPAIAEVPTPGLSNTEAMRFALMTLGSPGCPIDQNLLFDELRSIVHGPGFPKVTTSLEGPSVPRFSIFVTATEEPTTPGFNPAGRDRPISCSVKGEASLFYKSADLDTNSPDLLIWQAEITAAQGGLSPSSVSEYVNRVASEVVERFGMDWRQAQGR
jgi:hypothetical protein